MMRALTCSDDIPVVSMLFTATITSPSKTATTERVLVSVAAVCRATCGLCLVQVVVCVCVCVRV
jgi:hypothetical protein